MMHDAVTAPDLPPPAPFIVGAARSGTTLLRLMLDAHPALAIPPETHFMGALLRLGPDVDDKRGQFYKAIVLNPRWQDFHLSAEDFVAQLDAIRPLTTTAGLRCFYRMYAQRFGKARYGDKTPLHALHLAGIAQVLPEAHFVHLIRDGRDVAVSQLEHFGHDKPDEVRYIARMWKDTILETRRQAAACRQHIEVRYETLVRDTTQVLTQISSFLGLPYDARMESYYVGAKTRLDEFADLHNGAGELIETRTMRLSKHGRAAEPPTDVRVGRWRHELRDADRAAFERVAGPLLADLGYEV